MNRKIIAYKDYFNTFFAELDKGTQDKVLYVLMLLRTQDRLPTKFIKAIRDGLFEVRIEYNSNIYRIFFVFDGNKIVVLFNGFQKKTQTTHTGGTTAADEAGLDSMGCLGLSL